VLVDDINDSLNTYHYSLVQFHSQKTGEIFNIGVILNDRKDFHIHLPRHFHALSSTCIEFKEIAGINFTLDIIEDRIKRYGKVESGDISNSIFITEERSMLSELSCEEALQEAANKYMMLKKLRTIITSSHVDRFDKMTILRSVNAAAERRKIDNFIQHIRFPIARKIIDMSLLDHNKNPYSIASVASIHKEHFDDNIITAIYTLQEAMRSDMVKDQFLYIPILKRLKDKETLGMGWAKEQARHIGVDIMCLIRHESVLEGGYESLFYRLKLHLY